MAEPTDGPWTVKHIPGRELTGTEAEIAEIEDCEPYDLATVEIPEIGFGRCWDDRLEQEDDHLANARLIAKARHLPALVEALEAAIPFLREHTICTAMRADGNAAECQAHDVAVRALALVQDEDHG